MARHLAMPWLGTVLFVAGCLTTPDADEDPSTSSGSSTGATSSESQTSVMTSQTSGGSTTDTTTAGPTTTEGPTTGSIPTSGTGCGGLVCDGECVDPMSDDDHCGGCNSPCTVGGEACVQGNCAIPFDARYVITLESSSALDDFQVPIDLSPTNFNYNDPQLDGSDIRLSSDGVFGDLDYWIQSWDPAGDSRVWVRVPAIPSGTSTIYLLAGNANQTADDDPEAVFEFFEDASGTDPTLKWSSTNLSVGEVEYLAGQFHVRTPASTWGYVEANVSFDAPVVIEHQYEASNSNAGFMILESDSENRLFWNRDIGEMLSTGRADQNHSRSNVDQNYPAVRAAVGAPQEYRVAVDIAPGGDLRVLEYCNLTESVCDSEQTIDVPAFNPFGPSFIPGFSVANTDIWVDWFFVRKWAADMPDVSVVKED